MRPSFIGALTGIRAIAAFWVFFRHIRPQLVDALGSGQMTQFVIHIASVGYLGVDLFFILSGFILTYTHLDTMTTDYSWKKAVGFLWLRFARVWPLAAFVLMVFGAYFVFQAVSSGDPGYYSQADPVRLLMHLTLINGWFPAPLDWNGVDWSVSAEWLAYLTFSVGVVALLRYRQTASRRVMLVTMMLMMLPIMIIGFSMQDDTILLFGNDSYVTAAGVIPIRVLSEFWVGAILALVTRRYLVPNAPRPASLWRLPVPSITAVSIIVAILLVSRFDPVSNIRAGQAELYRGIDMIAPSESIIILPLLVLLIASLALCPRDPLARLLATRVFLLGGRASYAFYLVHPLVIGVGLIVLSRVGSAGDGPHPLVMGVVLGTAAAAWVAAWLLWRFIEEPARRVLRRMLPESVNL